MHIDSTLLRRFTTALLCCLSCLSVHAQTQIIFREIIATGNGGDISSATIDAIENAIGQVGGMKISATTSLSLSEVPRNGSTNFEESFKQDIEKLTRGVVKTYSVLESGSSPGSGRSFVKIKATIPSYKPSDQLKRLKLAVMPLTVAGAAKGNPEAANFAESVSSSLEAYLTQTRKFAMIDRRYTEKSNRVLAGVNARNAPIEETVKLGVRVGADYIVLAVIKEFDPHETQQQRVTGRVVNRTVAPVGIDIRVIDIASGQIKFAQTYNNPGRLPSTVALRQYAADIGTDIGQVISTAIYPVAVVGGSGNEVTLNQGGDTVQVGRVYRIVSLGKNLVDPYTHESLGPEEREVAQAEVVSVTDRTAVAKIISGNLPSALKPGAFLARVQADIPGASLNVKVSLPSFPSMSDSNADGKKKKDDDDW
jgi:hypothetical protein